MNPQKVWNVKLEMAYSFSIQSVKITVYSVNITIEFVSQSTVFQKQSSTYLNDLYGTQLDETFEIAIHITLQTKQDNSEQNWTKQE